MDVNILLYIGYPFAFLILILLTKHYLLKYFEEKGKNLATKEDIDEITRKVETIKAEIDLVHTIQQTKYKLKYDAMLRSLELIDAYCSNIILQESMKKQFFTTEDARKCFNEMILTVKDENILNTFIGILSYREGTSSPLLEMLNKYRNLVRKELEFGNDIFLDKDNVFITHVKCDPEINDKLN